MQLPACLESECGPLSGVIVVPPCRQPSNHGADPASWNHRTHTPYHRESNVGTLDVSGGRIVLESCSNQLVRLRKRVLSQTPSDNCQDLFAHQASRETLKSITFSQNVVVRDPSFRFGPFPSVTSGTAQCSLLQLSKLTPR